jgi:hypothetical protein
MMVNGWLHALLLTLVVRSATAHSWTQAHATHAVESCGIACEAQGPRDFTQGYVEAKHWLTWGSKMGQNLHDRLGSTAAIAREKVTTLITSGDTVFLRSYSGSYVEVIRDKVKARGRGSHQGSRQAFVISKQEVGLVYPGDLVYLTASSGRRLEVEHDSTEVRAKSRLLGPKQTFVIERHRSGSDPIQLGDYVFLRAHTGKLLDVFGSEDVQARFAVPQGPQGFVLERQI